MTDYSSQHRDFYSKLYCKDMFVDQSTADEYTCPICICVLKEPQQLAIDNCEHLYCKQCITNYFNTRPVPNKCPTCQCPATAANVRPAHRTIVNLIDKLECRCYYYGEGCTATMRVEQLESHSATCRHRPCGPTSATPTAGGIPMSGTPITVFVKLAGARTVNISTGINDTVKTFKGRLREKEAVEVDRLVLIFGSKPMDNSKRLSDYGIRNSSIVFTTRRFDGGVYVG